MFARRIGIFSRCSNTSIPRKHLSLVHIPRSSLHVTTIVDIRVGTSKKLKNNFDEKSDIELYKHKSWQVFKKHLTPNRLHIFMCPANLKVRPILAGHVASFVTDNDGEIINGSVMSLQNGNGFFKNENGEPIPIKSDIRGIRIPEYLKTVRFMQNMKMELGNHFFNTKSSTFSRTHYLFSVPITADHLELILNNVEKTISLYENEAFQLFNAYVNGEFRRAVNCCFGFYQAMGVKGKIADPSPQMVTWSFLLFIYKNLFDDESLRDKLIAQSGIKENSLFKEDDELEWNTPRP